MDQVPQVTQPQVEDNDNYPPWGIMNERDSSRVVDFFLSGFSPSKISQLTSRSLIFIYSVLKSDEARVKIEAFDQARAEGVLNVQRRLDMATVELTDELLQIARSGKVEANKLKAILNVLGMRGISPIQKSQVLRATVYIPAGALQAALKVAEEAAEDFLPRTVNIPHVVPEVSQPNQCQKPQHEGEVLRGESLLSRLVGAVNAGGPTGDGESDGGSGRDASGRLEAQSQAEPILPRQGDTWIRSDDELSSQAFVSAPSKKGREEEDDRLASGPLQEHDRDKELSSVAPDQRPVEANPYYKCNGN